MKIKNPLLNILGQIRIYSLIDLILFAYAIGSERSELIGIVLLHISFLFYLEYSHKHSYRLLIPKIIWVIIGLAGIILYPKIAVAGYLITSFLYAKKNSPKLAPFSPFFRGAQSYFLAAGIVGFTNPIAFLTFGILAIRNFAGDVRDIEKDRKEKMRTLPIIFGMTGSYKRIHLIALLITSFVWWYLASISILWLFLIYLVQILVYDLTPR